MWETSDTVIKGRTERETFHLLPTPGYRPELQMTELQKQCLKNLGGRKYKVPKCIYIYQCTPRMLLLRQSTGIFHGTMRYTFFTIDNPISFEKQIDTFDFLCFKVGNTFILLIKQVK